MLNAANIAASLSGLVGWHPATDGNPEGPMHLNTAQLASRSGLYVNDLNELLSLAVLVDAMPEGEVLADWIERLTNDALLRLTGRLAATQGLDGKVLLSDQALLPGPGRAADTINKLGRFVGLRLSPTYRRGVAYSVPRLSIQLDAVQATPLDIYVYSSDQPEPIKVITLPAGYNKPGYPYRFELEEENALSLSFAARIGVWAYIGYYENDLTGHAINRDGIGVSCGCTADPFPLYDPYLKVCGISAASQYLQSDRLSPLFDNNSFESSNFGLDVQLTGFCDTATALLQPANQLQLGPLVQQALANRFLEALTSSPNLTQATQRQSLQADAYAALRLGKAALEGGTVDEVRYEGLLSKVALDLTGLDSACLPQKASLLSMGSLNRK